MLQQAEIIFEELRKSEKQFVEIRRDIHAHPELGFSETRTSALVARLLEEWGYEVTVGLGATGVVGRLSRGNSKRSIALRADMDALPIQEATGLPYASKVSGTMHACGHDGHTSILLAGAHYLSKVSFDGTLIVIFQPAEEGLGGASRMIDEGLFDRFPVDYVFAVHNAPGLPVGKFALRLGCMMASSDTATISVTGRGTHAALPQTGCDPIVAAAHVVTALQSVVSRNVDPARAAVVTVGSFNSGTAPNLIPESAKLCLSLRAVDSETRDRMVTRVREVAEHQARSFGASASVKIERISPALLNDRAAAELAIEVLETAFGKESVALLPDAIMGSEDFAFMTEKVPGCYVALGNGTGSSGGCMIHNPGYDFNDDALLWGAAFFVALTQHYLSAR